MITMYALSCVISQDDMIALGSMLGYIFGVNIGFILSTAEDCSASQ